MGPRITVSKADRNLHLQAIQGLLVKLCETTENESDHFICIPKPGSLMAIVNILTDSHISYTLQFDD